MRQLLNMGRSRPFWAGLIGMVVGVIIVAAIIHLWSDHVALHAMLNYLNTHAERINKLP